jgi:predicted GNAT superfamily acetyltransferase
VPDHLLITMQKNGGLVLGAFEAAPGAEEEELIGFAFSFVGLTSDGRVKHCSHMAGVAPAFRDRNVGYRIKLAQREHVLGRGIDLITWTFDPLESRNARLNFRKLGATCATYLREVYGPMRDGLNVGLPSDRFQVDWHIASAHVAGRFRGDWAGPTLSALHAGGVSILNPALPGDPPRPPDTVLPLGSHRALIQIPAHFQAIKTTDLGLAQAWRIHTRSLFETAFVAGYTVVDLLHEGGQSCYLLEKDWKPE